MAAKSVICLMGPTASGKTALAVEWAQQFPCDIISVDSSMVYRGMDIGTAKPHADVLKVAPHRLIDICDPKEVYSAGQFCQDALREIERIHAQGRIPLLVGGTMLYFRVLQQGLAQLPTRNSDLRAKIQDMAEQKGWQAMHAYLATLDAQAAARIHANDSQRIQRALEVCLLTGQSISAMQAQETHALSEFSFYNIALAPSDRAGLHQRIAHRFTQMLQQGLVQEVKALYQRGDLSPHLPSMRSVGYRQVWAYLTGDINEQEMQAQAVAATRQLAKRQLTWLRSWPGLTLFDSDLGDDAGKLYNWLKKIIEKS